MCAYTNKEKRGGTFENVGCKFRYCFKEMMHLSAASIVSNQTFTIVLIKQNLTRRKRKKTYKTNPHPLSLSLTCRVNVRTLRISPQGLASEKLDLRLNGIRDPSSAAIRRSVWKRDGRLSRRRWNLGGRRLPLRLNLRQRWRNPKERLSDDSDPAGKKELSAGPAPSLGSTKESQHKAHIETPPARLRWI